MQDDSDLQTSSDPRLGSVPPSEMTLGWWTRPVPLLAVALVSTLIPLLVNWGTIGVADFDQFSAFNQIAVWWHELGDYGALWDPFLCGGATLVGNPQIPLFHVNLPIYWLFGPSNGLGVSQLLWATVGFAGMFQLTRYLGLRRPVAAWIATAWVLNGYFIGQLGSMHIMYTASHLLPTMFLMNMRIAREGHLGFVAAVPVLLAIAGSYNHHFLAYSFPFVVGHFGVEWLLVGRRSRRLGTLMMYAVAVALSLGMLSLFLLPSLEWNADFPRLKAGEFEPPLNLIQMLLLPVQIVPFEVEHDMFERYYTVGPVLFFFLVVGLWRKIWARPEIRGLVIVCAIAFVTAVGSMEPLGWPTVAPFDLLRRYVPGYPAMRVPSRFFINGVPALLLIIGFEWQRRMDEGRWASRRQLQILAAALVPLWLFNFAYFQFSLFSEARAVYRPQNAALTDDFRWAPPGHRFRMMRVLAPNVGVLNCYEALEVPRSPDLDPEAGFVLDSSFPHRVTREHWGEFVVRTADGAPAEGRIRFNFNHHRGWTVVEADGAARIASVERSPLTVELGGARSVRLRYEVSSWPTGVRISRWSLALSAAFAAACLGLHRRRRRASE